MDIVGSSPSWGQVTTTGRRRLPNFLWKQRNRGDGRRRSERITGERTWGSRLIWSNAEVMHLSSYRARMLTLSAGPGKRSFAQGKSTRNQRIERMWRDVKHFVADKFLDAFRELKSQGLLNPGVPLHLYCLHYVFLPLLQQAVTTWVQTWNWHHGAAKGAKGQSPVKVWHSGKSSPRRSHMCEES
jgi:hypothetical protein